LLGLASFLGPFCFETFWRFYSKGGECGTKASLWIKLTSGFKDAYKCFQGMIPKGENANMKIKKGEVRSRGVWIMASIQESVSESNFVQT
jgi:hypothetical protein